MFDPRNPLDMSFIENLRRIAGAQEGQKNAIQELASNMAKIADALKKISTAFDYNFETGLSRFRVDLSQKHSE